LIIIFHVFAQVMESMRRQVEYLTLENERLQSQLKEALSSADSPGVAVWNDDEDGDGMQRAADLSTLTIDAQRSSSASSRIPRKAQGTTSFVNKTALPSAHAAPLLQFTPGAVQPALDKYANDFDFSLPPQQQQPPVPPPLPIYNSEILQAPHSISSHKQPSIANLLNVNSSKVDDSPRTPDRHSNRASAVRAAPSETSMTAPGVAIPALHSSAYPTASKQKVDRPSSAAPARALPPIAASIMQAAEVALASQADRASEHSANSERSAFSVGEANEGCVI